MATDSVYIASWNKPRNGWPARDWSPADGQPLQSPSLHRNGGGEGANKTGRAWNGLRDIGHRLCSTLFANTMLAKLATAASMCTCSPSSSQTCGGDCRAIPSQATGTHYQKQTLSQPKAVRHPIQYSYVLLVLPILSLPPYLNDSNHVRLFDNKPSTPFANDIYISCTYQIFLEASIDSHKMTWQDICFEFRGIRKLVY